MGGDFYFFFSLAVLLYLVVFIQSFCRFLLPRNRFHVFCLLWTASCICVFALFFRDADFFIVCTRYDLVCFVFPLRS